MGSEIRFSARSGQDYHGFAVIGTDIVVPLLHNEVTEVSHVFDEPGEYLWVCSEYCGAGHANMNGKIIVAGGRFGPGAGAERTDVVEIYDPATRTWTRGAPLPAPRGGITAAVHGGCMFVFGGEGERTHVLGLTPTVYGYDPRENRWTRLPDLPIAVHGLKGSAVIGGRIFLPGGGITLGGNSGTNAMQVYRPTMRCE